MNTPLLLAALFLCYVACASTETVVNFYDKGKPTSNIGQCSWDDLNEHTDEGEVTSCTFTKDANSSVLRVAWYGTVRADSSESDPSKNSCTRWYFTINGEECTSPGNIDMIVDLHAYEIERHRPGSLEGLCTGVASGTVTVALNVGLCPSNFGILADAVTGKGTYSRIILEEINVSDIASIA